MKSERGSRSDLAQSSHHEDLDVDACGHDDDPKLHAMRAVWLTMRDEDPPDRGLAELLAAAHTKAETMQLRPPLWQRLLASLRRPPPRRFRGARCIRGWQRLLAGLRRPPALALTTVMVLLGGAVILGRRGVDVPAPIRAHEASGRAAMEPAPGDTLMPARPRAADERAVPVATLTKPAPADGSAGSVAGLTDSAPADERAAPAPALAKAGLASETIVPAEASLKPAAKVAPTDSRPAPAGAWAKAEPAAVATAGNRRSAAPAPVVTVLPDTEAVTGSHDEPQAPHVHDPAKPPPNAAAQGAMLSEPAREPAGASDDLAGTSGAAHNEPPAPADTGKSTKKVKRDITKHDGAKDSTSVELEQLYTQCEAAARRGDCDAVRRLVDRITKSDRGYRARVPKDSAVTTCLAE